MNVYVVVAYRWGNREWHSYVVGVYSDPQEALLAASREEAYRGHGKYECEVGTFLLDNADTEYDPVMIKSLDDVVPDRINPTERLGAIVSEVESVLEILDGLAAQWGDEAVFRRCRDRLRAQLEYRK